MGSTYYVDPAAGGSNNGSSWTDAWTSIQSAFDTATAGDVVYCKGTQTTAATLDIDTQQGSNAAGYVKYVGCNSLGNVDGTRFVIDVNNTAVHGITVGNYDMYWFENFEIKNAGAGGDSKDGVNFAASTATGWTFINCSFHNCSGYGVNDGSSAYLGFSLFVRCAFYSNTLGGMFDSSVSNLICFSSFRDNTGDGAAISSIFLGCVIHGNGDDGIDTRSGSSARLINCVIDNNTDDGIYWVAGANAYTPIVLGSRITNHSGSGDVGINANSDPLITGWCYFENNDGDNIQNGTIAQFIPAEGGSTTSNLEDLSNTDYGYVDSANHDFSTRYVDSGDPDLRRTAITVPWS
jgi:parallel beta-helix repeat protein